jgi:hypothetical protein
VSAPAQCGRCVHWARTGGIIAPSVRRCVALDDAAAAPVLAVLRLVLADVAAAGRCPLCDHGTDAPDAYRSLDLDEINPT